LRAESIVVPTMPLNSDGRGYNLLFMIQGLTARQQTIRIIYNPDKLEIRSPHSEVILFRCSEYVQS
jgi:hypothetical protein